jgi:hypothetical protein
LPAIKTVIKHKTTKQDLTAFRTMSPHEFLALVAQSMASRPTFVLNVDLELLLAFKRFYSQPPGNVHLGRASQANDDAKLRHSSYNGLREVQDSAPIQEIE